MLEPDEQADLTKLLIQLYDFGDPRGRRVLLEQAKLGKFLGGIDLAGPPRVVAGAIINQLVDHGPLAERPAYHALGALLSYLLSLGDLPTADEKFLATLIVKYGLVTDPQYVEGLRKRYDLAAAAPAVAPPKPPAAAKPEPVFQPAFHDAKGLEQVINSEDNFLDIDLLSGAIQCAKAVCRIEFPVGTSMGTGFLIHKDLILTNRHVLPSADYLADAVARFDYQLDSSGVVAPGRVFRFKADFYHGSLEDQLDYALVRLDGTPLEQEIAAGHRGYLLMAPRFIRAQERVNIIQHPAGNPMKVVLTQNYVTADMKDSRVHYLADTQPGSSGSPVFDQHWNVVALHHSGKPYPPEGAEEAAVRVLKGHLRVNEGIPVRALLAEWKVKGIEKYLPAA